MKKVIAIFFACCLIVGSFVGCAQNAPKTTSSNASSGITKQNVTITYMASQDWVKPEEQTLAQTFEAQTGIHVDFQIVPSAQYLNMLSAKLASGECTDIYGNNTDPFSLATIYNAPKYAVDLTSQKWASEEDPLCSALSSVNGKIYGLTLDDVSSQWVVVYNKTIFAKYNLSVPKTFADFETICQTLKTNGITPIYECVSDGWHHVLWFPELGGAIGNLQSNLVANLNDNKIKFADIPAALTALTQIQDMVTKGYWGTDYMSQTYANTEMNMASGKFAMTINNLAEPANIAAKFTNVTADDFGFFPNPVLDNQYQDVNLCGPTMFIWTGSKHISQAEQYFDFLTTKENLQTLIIKEPTYNTLPFSSMGLINKYGTDINNYFADYPQKATVLQTSVKYVNADWMDLGKDMSAMFVGSIKPLQVLTDLDNARAAAATAAKDPAWS